MLQVHGDAQISTENSPEHEPVFASLQPVPFHSCTGDQENESQVGESSTNAYETVESLADMVQIEAETIKEVCDMFSYYGGEVVIEDEPNETH